MSERNEFNPVIVFDGDCVLCSASAQFIMRHDHQRLFRLTTSQSDAGRRLYRRFGLDPDALATMIVVDGERVFAESEAVLAIAARLGWPWQLAAIARIVPRWLRDRGYRLVARNRYRWFGKRAACWRPEPREADRSCEPDPSPWRLWRVRRPDLAEVGGRGSRECGGSQPPQ
jgi:salicylate hydroxylase